MKFILTTLLALPLLAGCTGLTGTLSQLKDDPAIVKMDIVTLYGTGKFVRVGSNTNTVVIEPDGSVHINEKK